MSSYIELPVETNAETLAADAFEYLQDAIPGWEPNDGNLETIMIEAFSRLSAEVRDVASAVPRSIFRYFGQLVGTLPIQAQRATGTTTWTMINSAGYTIRAGQQVGIRTAGDNLVAFEVIQDYTIAPGNTSRADVIVRAVEPGAAASGIGSIAGPVELIDPLDYVSTVTLNAVTSGGVDAETDSDYLDRLSQRLTLLTPRPILARDFATLARDVGGVSRAMVLDGYDPGNNSYNNERMVAVAVTDEDGNALSSDVKNEVDALLQETREVNFIVNVIDPEYTDVDVTYSVVALPGYTASDLESAINAALTAYTSPGNWGTPVDGDIVSGVNWVPTNTVRYLEVATVINNVQGVDYIASLAIGVNGGAQDQNDKTLGGAAALATTGSISGSVTVP